MKAWVLSLVMAVFGFGQMACACPAPSPHTAAKTETVRAHHHDAMADAAMGDMHHAATPAPEHEGDCLHCQQTLWASGATTPGTGIAPPDAGAGAAAILVPDMFVPLAGSLSGSNSPRTWLDPPGRTPISLKVKIQN